jgi:hypothetical protein
MELKNGVIKVIDYGRIQSTERPQDVEMTDTQVFIADNIEEYEKEIDKHVVQGFEYDYKSYTKDEYIQLLNDKNARAIAALQEELAAAKILLGVE